MRSLILGVAFASVLPVPATSWAADPAKADRAIRKEPAYKTKAPKYGLLAFGADGKDRVWLVRDGDVLYVDRNGNGDLTEPGKAVAADKKPGRDPREDGYNFDVGDVTVGGRTHKGLAVGFTPLKRYGDDSFGKLPDVKATLAKDPAAMATSLSIDVDAPGLKGSGIGGRLSFSAGPIDLSGVLHFADTPAEAPTVFLGGPLQITFYGELPSLRVGRGSELILVVGTPGVGHGTFAMLGYEGTIPATAKPVADVSLPPGTAGAAPAPEKWVIPDRC